MTHKMQAPSVGEEAFNPLDVEVSSALLGTRDLRVNLRYTVASR